MKTLIVYATYSGSTETAANIVLDSLKSKGYEADIKQVSQIQIDQLTDYELVILASPSWDYDGHEGMPHEDFVKFFESAKGQAFENKKFAVLGLGDSSYAVFCGCVAHLEKFVSDIKGQLVQPSLKIDGFFFAQEENTAKIKSWAEKL